MQNCNSKSKNDLKHRVYRFAVEVVRFCASVPDNKISAPLVNQLIRCGTSVGANVIEAQAASSRRDFAKFIQIALKSANETKFWLCLMRDSLEVRNKRQEDLLREAVEISRILGASTLTLKKG
jgi:four helix bundle protein